jgi:hypothetical protein
MLRALYAVGTTRESSVGVAAVTWGLAGSFFLVLGC